MYCCITGKAEGNIDQDIYGKTSFLLFERVHASSVETVVNKCLADLTLGQGLCLAGEMVFIVCFDLHS